MPKYICEQVRQRVIEIAEQHSFAAQLKDSGEDQYVKVLMFYSKQLNQTVYIRKDRAVGSGGIPDYFQVAMHPAFFNKSWVSVSDGIQEHINSQKKKNLHSSSYYQKFPVFSENNEPCGMCFKVTDYNALAKLFQRMATGEVIVSKQPVVFSTQPVIKQVTESDMVITSISNSAINKHKQSISKINVSANSGIPTKGLIIKSPYIEKILAGTKTWEMRSKSTQVRGPIALIKQGSGQVVGVANLIDVKGPLSKQDKLNTIEKHQISAERLESGETDKWNTAWILENAQPLISPVNYQHPNGAVIWVNLDKQAQKKLAIVMQ